MIVITFLNWVANLLHGTQFDISSITTSFDILTEAIGFIGYFIPMSCYCYSWLFNRYLCL